MANGFTHAECYYTRRVRSGPKICGNGQFGCIFQSTVYAPTPKITPKPHFWGPFNAKPINVALRKSHVWSYEAET